MTIERAPMAPFFMLRKFHMFRMFHMYRKYRWILKSFSAIRITAEKHLQLEDGDDVPILVEKIFTIMLGIMKKALYLFIQILILWQRKLSTEQ